MQIHRRKCSNNFKPFSEHNNVNESSGVTDSNDHQVEDAKVAMGHAYGGAAQFFAMWIVSSSLD